MSYLLASVAESGRTIQAEALIPWIRGQVQGIEDVVIIFGGLLAAIILVIAAFKAKGGLAGIVMGGITAFVLVWLMNNMGTQDKPAELIDDQVENNGAPALVGGPAGLDGDVA